MIDDHVEADLLEDYELVKGERVEVELLVLSGVGAVPAGPRLIEGTVHAATGRVLILDVRQAGGRASSRTTRIPWPAIALIRSAVPPHPATT